MSMIFRTDSGSSCTWMKLKPKKMISCLFIILIISKWLN